MPASSFRVSCLRQGRHYSRTSVGPDASSLAGRSGLRFEQTAHHVVLEDMIATVEAATARRDRLTQEIEARLDDWSLAPVVRAVQALRGMALVNAATVIAELGDLTRFASPTAADGLSRAGALRSIPVADHRRQGGITKTGNNAARRMLVEASLELSFSTSGQS